MLLGYALHLLISFNVLSGLPDLLWCLSLVLLVLFVLAVWHCLNQIDEDLRILWDWVNRDDKDSVE